MRSPLKFLLGFIGATVYPHPLEEVDVLVDGYVRVSRIQGRTGASFISPELQREQIEGWAKLSGATIAHVYEELDESGARSDRPLLSEAIERVERGESGGIVVAKLDRFGRSLIDGIEKIERIDAAGGTFVSVQDGLDIGTPTGKLVLRIMLSMAEWELDRIRASWEAAQVRAVARGIHLCGNVPIGYKRGRDRRLKIDPKMGPVVAEIFRRRCEGLSTAALAEILNERGLKTQIAKSEFFPSTVYRILKNRVYLGEAWHGQAVNPRAHPAIVDEATWQQAQQWAKPRAKPTIKSALGGVLRCASCRGTLHASRAHARGTFAYVYSCSGSYCVERCSARARVHAAEIEPLVEAFVFRAARTLDGADPVALARVRERESALDRAQEGLIRYRDNLGLMDTLGSESFQAGLEKRMGAVEAAALKLAGSRRELGTPDVPPAAELEASWPTLPIVRRRQIVEEFVDAVFVEPGSESVLKRAYVCGRGDMPVDVPRGGARSERAVPFSPGAVRSVRLRPIKRWPISRIEGELRAFIGEGETWPSYVKFAIAGRAILHHQVLEWGGPYFWARRLDLKTPPWASTWTEQSIRGALRPLLQNRTSWPAAAEFEAVGLLNLQRAVEYHGGRELWARRYGLDPPKRSRRKWTEEGIEDQLSDFLRGRPTFPTTKEFRLAGKENLRTAIRRNGGQAIWAQRMGFDVAGSRT